MSAMSPLFLGLDVGTQGTKGVLVSANALEGVIATASAPHAMIPGLAAGAAEQHPADWVVAVATVCRALLATKGITAERIVAVSISGQQHGLVVLDEQDLVVRPAKLWCDTETVLESDELSRALGRSIPCGFTAPKVAWLARHEPENWRRIRTVFLPHDYINFVLTGEKVTEAGDASGTGYFDAVGRAYDARAMEQTAAGLSEKVPGLITSDQLVGTVTRDAAERFGLAVGTVVASGGGDNMMSAIGSGATRPGRVVMSLGTSGTAFAYSEAPILDPSGLIAGFCDSTGGYLPLLCVMNLTGVTEEVRQGFGGDHEVLTREAAALPVGCNGLLWVPFLNGERVPNLPGATGTLLGMVPGSLRRGALYRAALEGTSMNLGLGLARLRALGVDVASLRLVGGAAKNVLWQQILADIVGVPVEPLAVGESAALGAALQAQWAWRRSLGERLGVDEVAAPHVVGGTFTEPDAARHRAYVALTARFSAAVERLHGGS